MTSSCTFCHLPISSKGDNPIYCCYGCRLAAELNGEKRKGIFLRYGLGTALSLAVLLLWILPPLSSVFQNAAGFWFFSGFIVLSFALLSAPFIQHAVSSVLKGTYNSEILTALAGLLVFAVTLVSLWHQEGLRYFHILILFMVIPPLTHLIEARMRKNCSHDLEALKTHRTTRAHLVKGQQTIDVDISQLKKGDSIKIFPGEVVPCDGIVTAGTTRVDESMFTGESMPLLKAKGESVTEGSLNEDGTITVQVSSTGEDTFLEQTIRLMQRALERSVVVKRNLLPLLFVGLSLLGAAAAFYIQKNAGIDKALIVAATVLAVISLCPLTRGLSQVASLALGQTSKKGVLLKDARFFKNLAKLKILFFDKTGTLTKGDFYFSQLFLEQGVNQGTLLSAIFSLESLGKHPLCLGIKTHPWYLEIPKMEVRNFQSHSGLGLCGYLSARGKSEQFVTVGNIRFLKRYQMQISRAMREKVDERELMGETVLLCAWDGQARGLISFVETFRTDVKPMLDALQMLKIKPIMITSDHGQAIAHLTYAHGLNQIYERCLPEEKANKIKKQQEGGKIVGHVGARFDESPALSQADVGIIIGTGTNKVSEKAAVSLLSQNFSVLTSLLVYSRKVYRTVQMIKGMTVIYNSAGLLLAGLGLLNPWEALAAQSLVNLGLTALPLRLRAQMMPQTTSASGPEPATNRARPLLKEIPL